MAGSLLFVCFALFHFIANSQTTIPVPTISQLAYQTHEIVGLTHFNMATYFGDNDPSCNANNWVESQNPKSFKPLQLNISNWAESYRALGAKSAVLTVKHGCGFCLWNTDVELPNGNPYNYTSMQSSFPYDIIQIFVDTMVANDLGFGFYYSLTNNFYLNEYQHNIKPSSSLLPGQQNITQEQLQVIQTQHLTELFSRYGNITEFWFDGGTSGMVTVVTQLLEKYQPNTVVFNGQQVTANMIRWIGTESGIDKNPIWSMGESTGNGDPNSSVFCPGACDTTLQNDDTWFYSSSVGIRTLQALIEVYHSTVGNNGVLELDFAIDESGNVAEDQAQRYQQFGDWARSCYGSPLQHTNDRVIDSQNSTIVLSVVGDEIVFDRVMIQEDISKGQRIRNFTISVGGNVIESSTAVGHKRIVLLGANYSAPAEVELEVQKYVGKEVYVLYFAVFSPCPAS